MRLREKKGLAFAAVYASVYYVVSTFLGPLSFSVLNFRLSDSLLALVPVVGMPAVVGHTIGVFVTNIFSPLGPLDLANTIPSFVCSWLIFRLRNLSVLLGLSIYTIVLGLTVSLLISYVTNIPFLFAFASVTAGIGIVVIGAGYIIYRAILRAGVKRYAE